MGNGGRERDRASQREFASARNALETDPNKDDATPRVAPTADAPTNGSTAAVQSSDVWNAFSTVEIRVGRVVEALPFPEARKPAIKVRIDFGEFGKRWSSAQITDRYQVDQLLGRQVMAVTNLPPKRIAGFVSECLTLGVPNADGEVVLIAPDEEVPLGSRLF